VAQKKVEEQRLAELALQSSSDTPLSFELEGNQGAFFAASLAALGVGVGGLFFQYANAPKVEKPAPVVVKPAEEKKGFSLFAKPAPPAPPAPVVEEPKAGIKELIKKEEQILESVKTEGVKEALKKEEKLVVEEIKEIEKEVVKDVVKLEKEVVKDAVKLEEEVVKDAVVIEKEVIKEVKEAEKSIVEGLKTLEKDVVQEVKKLEKELEAELAGQETEAQKEFQEKKAALQDIDYSKVPTSGQAAGMKVDEVSEDLLKEIREGKFETGRFKSN